MLKPIQKIQLDNGLQVMLKEIHTAPIISHWLWYRVGSRDETPGKTGASHWVEHLQFKGTPNFPADDIEKAIARAGGVWNALTYLDWTTYYETMPADKIAIALQFEADRMVNSTFEPEEVESERTVVLSERQGKENSPGFLLNEAVRAAAFRVHPYHHEVIGDTADLESMTRDDLYAHYRSFYRPNNALLTMAGDFDAEVMRQRIEELYNPIPAGDVPHRLRRPEPAMRGEHRLTVEGPGETTLVEIAYRVPEASHQDFFPLLVLDSFLSGPSSLNLFGGGGLSNNTSRLYTKMIEEKNVAVDVMGGLPATIDPFLYSLHFIVHPQKTVDENLAVVEEEIQRLQDTLPGQDEIERAVKQVRALFAYGGESITNQAFWLGFAEIFDSYDWVINYIDKLAAVTPEDVQRVAQRYLVPKNRVIGVYHPNNKKI